jgi:DNA-binding transcriptional MerR regulator
MKYISKAIAGWFMESFLEDLLMKDAIIGNLQAATRSSHNMEKSLMPILRIGQAARASGMSAASIRFYEQQGLLSPAARSDNGYRVYNHKDIDRLRLIRTCRSLDMSLEEVRQLVNAPKGDPAGCTMTAQVLQEHLAHVEARILALQNLKAQLSEWVQPCKHEADDACPTQSALREGHALSSQPTPTLFDHV